MNRFAAQSRLAFQSLRQSPGFVFSVVATMSLTLAIVFVVVSLVNTYFIHPLDVHDEDNLYVIEQRIESDAGVYDGYQSYKGIVHWMRTQTVFDQAAAVSPSDMMVSSFPGEPKYVVTFASPDYFTLLNVPVILGRPLSKALKFDEPSNDVLISERLWKRYFDGAEDVIGQTITIQGGDMYKVIGVVGDEFSPPYMFYDGESDLWMHFGADPRYFNDGRWDNPWNNTYGSLKIIGTSKAGLSQQDVFNDFDTSIESIRAEWMEGYPGATDIAPIVRHFRTVELGDKGHLSLYLLAATLGLLIIAVLNVSNLFISKALSQHRTLALQAVLGAKRNTLFMSIFAQSFLLMMTSVALALFLAAWGIKGFKALTMGNLPLVGVVSIDSVVVLVALVTCLLLSFVFALVSASLVNFADLRKQLQQSGKNTGQQLSAGKTRLLVATQMAVATALIIVAAFSLSRTHDTLNRDMGVNIKNIHDLSVFVPYEGAMTPQERVERRNAVREKILSHPSVKSVSFGRSPVRQNIFAATLTDAQGNESIFMPQTWVGTDYFEQVGMEIIAGRSFSEEAMRGETFEVIVSASVAALLDPESDVIGKTYNGNGEDHLIVGISADFNHPNFFQEHQGRHLWWCTGPNGYNFVLTLQDGKSLSREALLKYVREYDQRFMIWEYLSLESELAKMLHIDNITLFGSYLLAAFTLILACIGIFGVLSYNLNMRRFEFGLRMALGAKTSRLYRLLGTDVIAPLLIGCVGASIVTVAVLLMQSTVLSAWLQYSPVFALPAVLFSLMIAVISGLVPLHNIIKRAPMRALRNE